MLGNGKRWLVDLMEGVRMWFCCRRAAAVRPSLRGRPGDMRACCMQQAAWLADLLGDEQDDKGISQLPCVPAYVDICAVAMCLDAGCFFVCAASRHTLLCSTETVWLQCSVFANIHKSLWLPECMKPQALLARFSGML